MPFWVKTVLIGQEVHYYMVYIAYLTELILQICNYAQKRRICRKNSKYALDENLYDHFCPRQKATLSRTEASKVKDDVSSWKVRVQLPKLILRPLLPSRLRLTI